MFEIVVLAILVLAVVGGAVLGAWEREAASRTWPAIRPEGAKGDPADEGAAVPGGEPQAAEQEARKAA